MPVQACTRIALHLPPTSHGMGRDNLTFYMAYVEYKIIFNIYNCEKIISQFMVVFLVHSQN